MLETITKKVISYCEIPEELTEDSWLSEKSMDSYVECHLDNSEPLDQLDQWFMNNYPELFKEESFFIKIDY